MANTVWPENPDKAKHSIPKINIMKLQFNRLHFCYKCASEVLAYGHFYTDGCAKHYWLVFLATGNEGQMSPLTPVQLPKDDSESTISWDTNLFACWWSCPPQHTYKNLAHKWQSAAWLLGCQAHSQPWRGHREVSLTTYGHRILLKQNVLKTDTLIFFPPCF